MKCELCGNEATVRDTLIRAGKVTERHLCEECARKAGLKVSGHLPATQVFSQIVMNQAAGGSAEKIKAASAAACPSCGTTFAQFRHSGLLGCPACYAAFEAQLSPLLERHHEGGTHHVGKIPRRAAGQGQGSESTPRAVVVGGVQERRQRQAALRKQLEEAVASEQYERAAEIRDELSRMEAEAAPPKRARRGDAAGGERA